LIQPTIQEIHDILALDWKKAVLFLKGTGITEDNIDYIDSDFAKAIMIDQRMMDDPFITKKIYGLIKKRIIDAKIGVIKARGNYSIISGDPFALCQSMFGLEATGILKAGEIYNHYWLERDVDKVVCFRAPMTCANNVVEMTINGSEDARHWYQYMTACTLLNAWDTTAAALNGADKDGDLVFTTDNSILVGCHKQLPALMCAQRKAKKCVPSEEDIIKSNIVSFGDDIGKITNHITSMFDVIAQYDPGTREYEVLDYRIKCGQKFQQDSIDKAKGIISKPMPKGWYDRAAAKGNDEDDADAVQFNLKIAADKKPYFMRYIYPTLMRQYNTYISNTNKKALREFRMTMEELLERERVGELTKEEAEFLHYYRVKVPVGTHDCVMNRICRRFEDEFDGYIARHNSDIEFDYTIMKSGAEYSQTQYNTIFRLYEAYNKRVQDYMQYARKERLDEEEHTNLRFVMIQDFRRECQIACSNKNQLCDILLDMCYQKEGSKQFVWDMAGDDIIEALLKNNNGCISFPVHDENGDIAFGGEMFTFVTKQIGGESNEHCAE